MMNSLIADCNMPYCEKLATALRETGVFDRVDLVSNGLEAVELIINGDYDAVLLDTVLPGIDGIEVMNRIANMRRSHNIRLFVNSSVNTEYIYELCATQRLQYLFLKPNLPDVVAARVAEMSACPKYLGKMYLDVLELQLEDIVTKQLLSIGMPVNIMGFRLVRATVVLAAKQGNACYYITKDIYPKICEMYDVTASQIDRNIRNAIESTWNGRYRPNRDVTFGVASCDGRGVPTNAEFIMLLGDYAYKELLKAGIN